MQETRYSAAELEEMPVLSVSQADNLHVQTEDTRVWLCRCGVEDGMPYDNAVTVENLVDGRWVQVEQYPG